MEDLLKAFQMSDTSNSDSHNSADTIVTVIPYTNKSPPPSLPPSHPSSPQSHPSSQSHNADLIDSVEHSPSQPTLLENHATLEESLGIRDLPPLNNGPDEPSHTNSDGQDWRYVNRFGDRTIHGDRSAPRPEDEEPEKDKPKNDESENDQPGNDEPKKDEPESDEPKPESSTNTNDRVSERVSEVTGRTSDASGDEREPSERLESLEMEFGGVRGIVAVRLPSSPLTPTTNPPPTS